MKGWNNIRFLDWAADSKGILISNGPAGGAVLQHVDLRGNVHVLQKGPGIDAAHVLASPDGRHLAFGSEPVEGNVWLMENF